MFDFLKSYSSILFSTLRTLEIMSSVFNFPCPNYCWRWPKLTDSKYLFFYKDLTIILRCLSVKPKSEMSRCFMQNCEDSMMLQMFSTSSSANLAFTSCMLPSCTYTPSSSSCARRKDEILLPPILQYSSLQHYRRSEVSLTN